MGQQQLLLIVLGVIIIGIAVILGIALFRAQSVERKRDVVINEGINVANNAVAYYRKPNIFGGGHNSFTGWEIPAQMVSSPNGSYVATVSPDEVEIIGTGNDLVSGSDSVKVKITVTPAGMETSIIN